MNLTIMHGRWEDVFERYQTVDALITDPPYGKRTHDSEATRSDGVDASGLMPGYSAWTPAHVASFVNFWSQRVTGWIACMTSHDLIPAWESAHNDVGRLCFAPVPIVMPGMTCRMQGDGPSSWAIYLMVARPRRAAFLKWGTLRGYYEGPPGREASGGRGKPDWLLNAIVRDYSRQGDLVCDPMAGCGSTLRAALANNRRAIGSEVDAEAIAKAQEISHRGVQIDLFG